MSQEIKSISLPLPYRMGSVNCYLIKATAGFFLVDTGGTNNRGVVDQELRNAGCVPGNLQLTLITHGDFDHTGNARYVRETFGGQIAMHQDDYGMIKHGDMFWNRKPGSRFIKFLASFFFKLGNANRFEPDIFVENGSNLSDFGWNATVLTIPGHSKGSIGILTTNGELFCGDLFDNTKNPALNSLIDDHASANDSVNLLRRYPIKMVYPGHGKPFTLEEITN